MTSVQLTLGLEQPLILAYPESLFTPRAYQQPGAAPGQPRYSGMFLFPEGHPDLAVLFNAVDEMAAAQWQGVVRRDPSGAVVERSQMITWPFISGPAFADASADHKREVFRGYPVVLRASSAQERPPGLGVERDGAVTDVPVADRAQFRDRFWGGCHVWVRVGLSPRTQGNRGITAYLNAVCSYQSGDVIQALNSGQPSLSSIRANHRGVTHTQGSPYAVAGPSLLRPATSADPYGIRM